MNTDLFVGELVRLTAEEPETLAKYNSEWIRDSEYTRLLDADRSFPFSLRQIKKWIEKDLEPDQMAFNFGFAIRTLSENRLIGGIGLDGVKWPHGEAFAGIGVGERELWGKGYGTDAMRVILRYAFTELNLERVSLDVFGYNPRAIRSYEKIGFKFEGRVRNMLNRDGQRWDEIFMGILKAEWEGLQG